MPYLQEDTGQWWYVVRNYRSRAYPRTCLTCEATFYCRKSDRTRFCSARCGLLGARHPQWKGGRQILKGYVHVRLLDDSHVAAPMRGKAGYVAEHRLVMAMALGRSLGRHEHVHHINGAKSDNRLENLELRSTWHGPGVHFRCADCGSRNVHPAPLRAARAASAAPLSTRTPEAA